MVKKKVKDAQSSIITLSRLQDATIEIPVIGLTSIIMHRISAKVKRMMPGHPDKESIKTVKAKRDPVAEAEGAAYRWKKRAAFPAVAFKAATVGACRFFEGTTLVEAKQLLFIEGEGPEQLVPIVGKEELKEDMVKLDRAGADLRYRYYIHNWTAVLRVRYVPARITRDSVITLVDAGGRGGVGDWRPSSPKSLTGSYGTYRVDTTKEVKDVK